MNLDDLYVQCQTRRIIITYNIYTCILKVFTLHTHYNRPTFRLYMKQTQSLPVLYIYENNSIHKVIDKGIHIFRVILRELALQFLAIST